MRGLLPVRLGGTLRSNLTCAVDLAEWEKPEGRGRPSDTVSYAKWNLAAEAVHHQAPEYPKNRFPTEQAFYDWLAGWDRMIGFRPGITANTRLWEFIEAVKP